DRGVLEARRDERLAAEAGGLLAVGVEELLQRDGAAEVTIVGGDDAAHAAARDLALGDVLRGIDERQLLEAGRLGGRGAAGRGDRVLVRVDAGGRRRALGGHRAGRDGRVGRRVGRRSDGRGERVVVRWSV